MNPSECAAIDALLARSTRAFLISLRRDGSPTAHPMTGLSGDGRMLFNTYRKSAKARNLERDPRAAVVVVDGYDDPAPRAVAVEGKAQLDAPERFAAAVQSTSVTPRVSSGIGARVADRVASGKRVVISIEAEHTRSLAPLPIVTTVSAAEPRRDTD